MSDSTIKILVVDDLEENLMAMEELLDGYDVEMETALSGKEALAKTIRNEFALILLDVQMPEMDGFELARLLRANDKTRQIPIIFITAVSKDDELIEKGYREGAVDYILKPVNPVILRGKISIFIELHRQKIEQEKLIQQVKDKQKDLERSNKELENFASVVSHDLKEPLRKIIFYSDRILGRNEKIESGLKSEIQSISGASKRMNRFLNDLLDYSRANTKKIKLKEVDLVQEVESVVSDLEPRINDADATVIIRELPLINADPMQMRQLFQNIIGNAIKY